jgi:cobalt-zinc-cadmium efflux system outer membrane protein
MYLLRLLILPVFLPGVLLAGNVQDQSGGLTLAAVVRAGLERDPNGALPGAVQAEGEAARVAASSLLAADPSLFLHHESDVVASDDGYRNWQGGVEMPLWLPGQRDLYRRVADATKQEATALQRLQHWRMAGEVRELLWSLTIATAKLELARQALVSARKLQTDIEKRVSSGELARSEIILAQKETLAREADIVLAEAERETLQANYLNLTGLQEIPAVFTETMPTDTVIPEDHPALTAARIAAARARTERDRVSSARRGNPVLTLGGQSERDVRETSYDESVTMELSVPFGTHSHHAPQIAAAERSLTEAMIELRRTQRELENERGRVLAEAGQGRRTFKLSQQQAQLAEEDLRLMQRAFELGESDLFTLLQAHKQALAARRELRISQLELDRAHARMNQILGVIPE